MKSLNQQLIEFAARRVIATGISIAGRNAEHAVKDRLRDRRLQKAINRPIVGKRKKVSQMAFQNEPNFESASRTSGNGNRNDRNDRGRREPVELWVNTVIVTKKGEEPVRLLGGRPLASFRGDKDVTTSNEDFNRVNALNNSMINIMNSDAEELGLGESKYYSPVGVKLTEEGEPNLAPGIYIQLHREITDHAASAAAAHDIQAAAESDLRGLFGN